MTNISSIVDVIASDRNLVQELFESIPLIVEFCKKHDVMIEGIGIQTEEAKIGLAFYFNDNLGHYTKDGLLNSVVGEIIDIEAIYKTKF
ncbi:hypothetical protein J4468_01670 [Candidatus Woesearchaeota archaeon]|nr:hypothetical protein [Candidatus Woesearchaeota archaeon]